MIIDFRFSNYKSYRNKQDFTMRVDSSIDASKDTITLSDPINIELVRVAAFYGANAAGKSNFLGALRHLQHMVVFGEAKSDVFVADEGEPSVFEIVFISTNQKKYHYSLSISGGDVFSESLKVYNTNQPTLIFEYEYTTQRFVLGGMFEKDEETAIRYNFKKNPGQPLLKQLEQSSSEDAKGAFLFFKDLLLIHLSHVNSIELDPYKLTDVISRDPRIHDFVNRTLPAADFGIRSVNLVEDDAGINDEQAKILSDAMISFLRAGGKEVTDEEMKKLHEESLSTKIKKAMFRHEISNQITNFDLNQESDGTIAASSILLDLLTVLERGVTYIVDEIDRSLHPSIVAQIIDVFNDKQTNPHNAQLIFTTHDVSLMDSSVNGEGILDRNEIWFAEKNKDGESSIFPLSSIKYTTAKNDNIYKKYVGGRYGAIPKASLPYNIRLYWECRGDD